MTRAPVKLSREMKLLLMLLLMVGLIGLWYVWTNNRSESALAQQAGQTASSGNGNPDTVPVTPDSAPAGGVQGGSAQGGGAAPDTAGGASSGEQPLTVQPDGPVDVEVIPPFPTDETATAPTPPPAEVPEVPSGINPDGVITATPGRNPFRPLSLDANQNAPTTPTGAVASAPDTSAAGPVTAVVPSRAPSEVSGDPLGSSGGPLGLSPIPGADGSVNVDSGTVSGGALPIPVIPGADGSSGSGPTLVVPGAPEALPAPAGGTQGADTGTVTLTTPTPAPPPIAGVSVPSVTRLPQPQASAPTPASGTPGAGEDGGPAQGAPTALPTPGTPQVITELGRGDAANPAQTQTTGTGASALEEFVAGQELVFNAVVLGPVNTAIFRNKAGYVVVSSGQALPDSKVVVGAITPTSATLSLGNDSTILELDKR